MPCDSCIGMGDASSAEQKARELKVEVDNVTALLCSLCHTIQNSGVSLPPDIVKWYDAHKKWDEQNGRGVKETFDPYK